MGCRKHLQSVDDGGNSQDGVNLQNRSESEQPRMSSDDQGGAKG